MPPNRTREFQEFDEPHTQLAVRVKGFRPQVSRPHLLEVKSGPGSPARYVLSEPSYVIGRGERATLELQSEEVSRQHATLTRTDGEYTIEDLGSRNGIILNGLKVHAALLRDGDELQLGDVILSYREGA
jgi:pSer/pThr/pTyr-binding forkhead associated (FHA) protein